MKIYLTQFLKPTFLALFGLMYGVFSTSARSEVLSLVTADSDSIVIKVSPKKASANSLLEIIEAKTGICVKTVHAGTFTAGQDYTVKRNGSLPAGSYKVRYREDISLVFQKELQPAQGQKWNSPTDVCFAGNNVYVLDAGKQKLKDGDYWRQQAPPEYYVEEYADDLEEPFIAKFQRDGTLDSSFASDGRFSLDKTYSTWRSFAADPEGFVYIGSGHTVCIYDSTGQKTGQTIGGWDDDPAAPQTTPHVHSMALGGKDRIYLPDDGYGYIKVYDRTKDKFEGVLYTAELRYAGYGRMITADLDGSVYTINREGRLQKFTDSGKDLTASYYLDEDFKSARITGPSVSAGLIWIACHGGAPTWEGGQVALLWDNGEEIILVDRFGKPGTSTEELEFLNPSAVAQSPDHLDLWIAEDGEINLEGPPGNKRVRQFKISGAITEEKAFELK